MNNKQEIISIIIVYFLTITYIVLVNNTIATVVLVLFLLAFQLFILTKIKQKYSKDKETSISFFKSKLEKTKKEREEAYRRFISLSTTLGSGFLLIDEEGIIRLANKDIIDFFNRDLNDMDYQKIADIKPLYKFINQAYLKEERVREQIVYNDKYYDLISNPIFEKNLFKGSVVVIHDITLIKNAEKFQKRFTADVSHELRTPLSAIKGLSEILSRDEKIDSKEQKEFIELIHTESQRMEIILSDLISISKLDRLDYELDAHEVDIKQIINESIAILKNQFNQKNITSSIDIENQILFLERGKMIQVFLNIIKNAINYTDQGYVNIKGYVKDNNYIVEISDSGIGIKEDNYENIFKRFYRVDKDRSRDTGGSGLGLSISKNVIKKHGGEISVKSTFGKGTTFIIKLPIKK